MIHEFTIEGTPVAKARPRMTKQGHTYTPKKTVNYSEFVKLSFVQSIKNKNWNLLDCPIEIAITAYFMAPKSMPKKISSRPKLSKPDTDNLEKSIMDSLNGLAWVDDSRVFHSSTRKYEHRDRPYCHVVIKWM